MGGNPVGIGYNAPMNGRDPHDLPLAQSLTPREQEVLNCIGDEMSNRQIAEYLTIAMSTVKWYIRQVYNKLGVNNRSEAITRARKLGLLSAAEMPGKVRHNLPVDVTPFAGREHELVALGKLIANPQIGIITLIGPGGIGKTRLALEAARRELRPQDHFSDGIFFISLAPLESAEEIVSTLAAKLNFHFQSSEQGSRSESQQILDYLERKQMLLVMDNFEHILDGRMFLAELSKRAVKVKILVTSRERLNLRGEQLFPLRGLEVPQIDDTGTISLEAYPAIQLFMNISKRSVPDFKLNPEDVKHLVRICHLVEGMPLGLELAASWVGLLPLSAITAELEQGLNLLSSGHHDVPQRHRSMQATLDVSWNRLSSEQIRGFQGLTVFRGGFTRVAALEIAGVTLPILVTLVNKSWLLYDWERDRYYVHELLRQYGAAKLNAERSHDQALQYRHGAYFCNYLNEREADWFGDRQRNAVAEVRKEIDNIQKAWRWAVQRVDIPLLARGLNSLCRFYLWEGRMKDGQHACHSAGDGLSRSLSGPADNTAPGLALWARMLAWESQFAKEVTHKENLLIQSQRVLERVAPNSYDTRSEQAFIYLTKSYAALYADLDKVVPYASHGLELFRELADRWGEAEALQVLGVSYYFRGDFDQADDLLHSSLSIAKELGDLQGIAETILFLGVVAKYRGHFIEAEKLHQESLHLFQQVGNKWGESLCLSVLSYTFAWSGKFSAAYDTAELANEIDKDLGQYPVPRRLNPLTKSLIHLGQYERASTIAAESLELARQNDLRSEIGWALMYLGMLAFVKGDLSGAKRYLLECEETLAELKHIHLALSQAILGYLARAQGDGQLAKDCVVKALVSGIEYRSIYPVIYCLPLTALLIAESGGPARGLEIYGLAQQFAHIKNSYWFETIACLQLEKVRATLEADVALAAEIMGQKLDLWKTVDKLRVEISR